jgi:hypothetical protein
MTILTGVGRFTVWAIHLSIMQRQNSRVLAIRSSIFKNAFQVFNCSSVGTQFPQKGTAFIRSKAEIGTPIQDW